MRGISTKALLVVDVQRDFCAGGALAASNTESLLIALRDFIQIARKRDISVVFTQDWHPADHRSFAQHGGHWPVHCVADDPGAEIIPELEIALHDLVVHKGTTREMEGYSAFESTGLATELRSKNITSVAVSGIATEYCVRASALDAITAGFDVAVLSDLIRPVDENAVPQVIREMTRAGIRIVLARDWLNSER